MKVNINKGKTKKTYNLITSWDDVTLEKWQKLLSIKGKNTKKISPTLKAVNRRGGIVSIPSLPIG